MEKRVGYFVNCYPAPSHAFIRREILAVEALGWQVKRYAIRPFDGRLVDPDDLREAEKTVYVTQASMPSVLLAFGKALLGHPKGFLRALQLAVSMGFRSDRGILVHLLYLLEACLLLRWTQRDEVSHVHAHFGTNATTVPMLCQAMGGPTYSFTVHREEFDRPQAIGLGTKIHHARFVVAITSFCRSQLYRWCPYEEWEKIHVVRCGLDAFFLDAPLQPVPDVPRLVCVGRLCEQKGQMLLVEAAHILWEEGRRFEVIFVGDGDMRPHIEAVIERYGLHDCCHISGWASSAEVRDQLRNARATVLPSFAEGLPVVIMEAMALGRPVISTCIAGIPELLEDRKSGWLIVAGSVASLTNAIRQALDAHVDTLTEMGQHGARNVRQLHDIGVEAKKMADHFRHG